MSFWRGLGYTLGRGVGHTLAAFGLRRGRELVERFKRDDATPPPPALPPAVVVLLLAVVTFGCAQLRELGIGFGQGVIAGAKDCLSNPNDCAPTPRPIPMPPGRICAERDCDCWHDPANDRDYDWAFIACPRPTQTPVATQTPGIPLATATVTPTPATSPAATATPPQAPTAPPTVRNEPCATGVGPLWLSSTHGDWTPPATAVEVRKKGACPRFTTEVGPDRNGVVGCAVTWTKAPGEQGRTPAEGAHSSLVFKHVVIDPTDGMVRDVDNGKAEGGDAYGRTVSGGQLVPREDGLAWWDGAFAHPMRCPEKTPAPTTPGPAPTPSSPRPAQPRDFAFRWANVSDHARAFKDLGGGTCSYESDGALRWGGTLSSGEYYQNTADRDHWNCVVETCTPWPGQSPEDFAKMLADHRKTFELVGGDEWITPSGITVEARVVDGPALEVHKLKNPNQSEVKAPCGALITARGCLDAGAYSCPDAFRGERHESGELNEDGSPRHYSEYDCRPEHRRPIPGAGGCGQWKPPFEVR